MPIQTKQPRNRLFTPYIPLQSKREMSADIKLLSEKLFSRKKYLFASLFLLEKETWYNKKYNLSRQNFVAFLNIFMEIGEILKIIRPFDVLRW
jgi:hypothetical protein